MINNNNNKYEWIDIII